MAPFLCWFYRNKRALTWMAETLTNDQIGNVHHFECLLNQTIDVGGRSMIRRRAKNSCISQTGYLLLTWDLHNKHSSSLCVLLLLPVRSRPLSRTIGSSQHASGVAKLYSVNWLYCKNSNSSESWASEAGQGIYLAWRYIRTILYPLELHWCWEGGEPEKYEKWFDEIGFPLLTHSEEDFLDEIVRSFFLRRWWWGIVCH